jgi:Protein of unknown function (DUF2384)
MSPTAHREAMLTPVAEITTELQELVGQRAIAYATGLRSTKPIVGWRTGSSKPHPATEDRLRSLYRAAVVLDRAFGPETVRAWMSGSNPDLGERVPLDLMHERDAQAVIVAAERFAEESAG